MAVQFILGKSGSGKTTDLHKIIASKAKNEKIILFVPEQFTYETEKNLYKYLGAKSFQNVTVTSFTRFASEVFKIYGGISGEYATEPAKIILMESAINTIYEHLEIYKKTARSKIFSSTMLDTITELKNAGVTEDKLDLAIRNLPEDSYLYKKTKEIAIIYGAYNARLYTTYKDPNDDITRATKMLKGKKFFEDYTVFFDEFKGFTANENDILKLILSTAKDTFIGLCIDTNRTQNSDTSVFQSVVETYNKLMRFARESSQIIKPPIKLDQQYSTNSKLLNHLEQNILGMVIHKFNGENNGEITAMLCKNEYDEVDYILSTISHLIEYENYCFNDIAIISRDLDTYVTKLAVGCEKYNIAYYCDSRVKVTNEPLIRFILLCLNSVLNGYKSEDILGVLKCGLTNYTPFEIAQLENYTFVWGTQKKQWHEPFVLSPRGYTETLSDTDNEVLNQINSLREFIIIRLDNFSKKINQDNRTGKDISIAIISLIEDFKLKEYTESIISGFSQTGELTTAQKKLRVWEILIEMIDTLAVVSREQKIDAKQYYKMFNSIAETFDMGVVPQSLDCVIVGSAERIRIADKRAVFILGTNENVFPQVPKVAGVFTDKERETLISLEIEISPPIKNRILEERFIAYKTVTSPKERLYLTARKADITGKPISPSVIFYQLAQMFGEQIISDTEFISLEYFCRNKSTAFSQLASRYFENTPLTNTIKSVLEQDLTYKNKLDLLDNLTKKADHAITNKKFAQEIFGEEMRISPTRIEGYHQCAFKYFCEHGLSIRPLRKAELDPMETGTLIHSIIYSITKAVDLKENYDEIEIKRLIKLELDIYIETVMGGVKDKTNRFLYLYGRLRKSIFKVIEHLHEELSQSAFTPCDFEYEISQNSEIKPLKLVADNGVSITVSGKIDRIDSYTNAKGEKFIRIVDYKSGKKVFKLDDVYNGLNLQMLIYLFCIQHNGVGKYEQSMPAGILYMPASDVVPELPREATMSDVEEAKMQHYKMNGLILNDDNIIGAMDSVGKFIPISYNKDGSPSKKSYDSLASLEELSKIDKYIESLIKRMAKELHNGKISAFPMEDACKYCDYSSICARDESTKIKICEKISRDDVVIAMDKKVNEVNDNG